MGLFGGSRKWKCERCGEVHKSNPEECRACGHTILQQAGSKSNSSRGKPSKSSSGDGWMCSRCNHVHSDRKPFVCEECGSSALRAVRSGSTATTKPPAASTSGGSALGALLVWLLFVAGVSLLGYGIFAVVSGL